MYLKSSLDNEIDNFIDAMVFKACFLIHKLFDACEIGAIHTERGSIFVSEEALKYAPCAENASPGPNPDPPLYVIYLCVYEGMSLNQEVRMAHIMLCLLKSQ